MDQSVPGSVALMYEMKGKRVLVTGASGFIGRLLCRELVRLDSDVVALVRSSQIGPW